MGAILSNIIKDNSFYLIRKTNTCFPNLIRFPEEIQYPNALIFLILFEFFSDSTLIMIMPDSLTRQKVSIYTIMAS